MEIEESLIKEYFIDFLTQINSNPAHLNNKLDQLSSYLFSNITRFELENLKLYIKNKKPSEDINNSKYLARLSETFLKNLLKDNQSDPQNLFNKFLKDNNSHSSEVIFFYETGANEKILLTNLIFKTKNFLDIITKEEFNYFGIAVKKVQQIFHLSIILMSKNDQDHKARNPLKSELEENIEREIIDVINFLRCKEYGNKDNLYKHLLDYLDDDEKLFFNDLKIEKLENILKNKSSKKSPYKSNSIGSLITKKCVLQTISYNILQKFSQLRSEYNEIPSDYFKKVNRADFPYKSYYLNNNNQNFYEDIIHLDQKLFLGVIFDIEMKSNNLNQEELQKLIIKLYQHLLFSGVEVMYQEFASKQNNSNMFDFIELLSSENIFNYLGISICMTESNQKLNNKQSIFVCFVLSQEYKFLSIDQQKEFQSEFNLIINHIRKNPKSFLPDLESYKNKLSLLSTLNSKKIGIIDNLLPIFKNLESLPEVKFSETLTDAAYEYLHFVKDPTHKYFHEEDEDLFKIRLGHYIENIEKLKNIKELVFNTNNNLLSHNIREFIIEILLYEYEKNSHEKLPKSHKSSITILNNIYKQYGLQNRKFNNKKTNVFVLIVAEDFKEKNINNNSWQEDQESFRSLKLKNELLKDLNNIRIYPRSYIKYLFPNKGKDFSYNLFSTDQGHKYINIKDNQKIFKKCSVNINNEENLKSFLANTRRFDKLIEEPEISNIASKIFYEKFNQESEENLVSENKFINIVNNIKLNNMMQPENKKLSFSNNKKYGMSQNTDDEYSMILNQIQKSLNGCRKIFNLNCAKKSRSSVEIILDIIQDQHNREIVFSNTFKYIGLFFYSSMDIHYCNIIFCDNLIKRNLKINANKNLYLHSEKRPKLTEDEIDLIKNDFLLLDYNSIGKIFPQFILLLLEENIFEENVNLLYKNTLNYYLMNNPHMRGKGINSEEFVELINDYLNIVNLDSNDFEQIFNIINKYYYHDDENEYFQPRKDKFINKNFIDFDVFKKLVLECNLSFNDNELEAIFLNVTYPERVLTRNKFIRMMCCQQGIQNSKKITEGYSIDKSDKKHIINKYLNTKKDDKIIFKIKDSKNHGLSNVKPDVRNKDINPPENQQNEKIQISVVRRNTDSKYSSIYMNNK